MEPSKEQPQYEKDNILRRRYYITATLGRGEHKKIRRWLDHKDSLEIATDGSNNILITNQTAIQATSRSRKLFGITDGPEKISKPSTEKGQQPIEYETVELRIPKVLMEFVRATPAHYGLEATAFLEYGLVDFIRSDLEATDGEDVIRWNGLGFVFREILKDQRF